MDGLSRQLAPVFLASLGKSTIWHLQTRLWHREPRRVRFRHRGADIPASPLRHTRKFEGVLKAIAGMQTHTKDTFPVHLSFNKHLEAPATPTAQQRVFVIFIVNEPTPLHVRQGRRCVI
jgi:hypothetical protein